MNSLIVSLLVALSAMGDGHQLTALWNQYQEACKADLPKKEASILHQIKKEAAAKHLTVDFWDAATGYVYSVQRRDWKQRASLREALAKEVEEFNEPVVTFLWRMEWGGFGSKDLLQMLKDTPLKGSNPALHSGVEYYLGGALAEFIDSDQEWALWRLFSDSKEELKELEKGRYPQEGILKYLLLSNSDREQQRKDLQALQQEYSGKALALFPEADLLSMEMQDLEKEKAKGSDFKAFYEKCLQFERRRAAFKAEEKVLSSRCTSVESLIDRLTDKNLQVSAGKDSIQVLLRNLTGAKVTLYQDKNVVATWNAVNKVNSFYAYDTLRLALPALRDGSYRIGAESGKLNCEAQYQKYTLSIATRTDAQGHKVFVADYESGKPLPSAQILLMSGDKEVAKASVSLSGFTLLPSAMEKIIKAHPKTSYTLVASKEDRLSKPVVIIREANVRVPDTSVKCNVYKDRGAYIPGDTLKAKLVVYQGDPMTNLSVLAGKKLDVTLYDSEGNKLESKALKTNQWGSSSVEFAIPEGLRNGTFSLQVKDKDRVLTWEYIRVDEFVLPTFTVSFDKRTELYLEGSKVPVSGKVRSYSGHSLSGAKVRIRASLWSGLVLEDEAPLLSDGLFRFEVPSGVTGHYSAQVTVVDATGETLSFNDNFYVGSTVSVDIKVKGAEDANLSLPSDSRGWRYAREPRYVVQSKQFGVVFQAKDAAGSPVPMDVKYEVCNDGGKAVHDGSAPSGEEVMLTVTESGLYTIKATVMDNTKENKVLVILPEETEFKVPLSRLFIAGPATVDGNINTRVGTSDGDAWMVTSVFGKDSQLLESGFQYIPNGQIQALTQEYKASWPDAVRLDYYYFTGGKAVHYERQYRRERSKVALPLEFTSFTDKAIPGTRYTFTLKTQPGVEAVAAAWDKSMDAIRANYWGVVSQADYTVPAVSIMASCGMVGEPAYDYPVLYSLRGTKAMATMNKAVALDDSVEYESASVDMAEAGAAAEDVPVRTEFLSALTFQPHLQSEKDGSLRFSFSTSDKLSTYYVRVYAHDKAMHNALVQGEMLVSIPVKVSMQEPRFLYEGDVWEAAVVVSSIADEPISGILSLEWKGGGAKVPVTVPAGETVTRSFVVSAPQDDSFTATFRSAGFSDAIRVTVPILPASQTLTEAHSAVLHPSDESEALLKELRSRFVNVPGEDAILKEITVMDMVRDAIPSHVEPKGDDVLSLSEAWYVQHLADIDGEDRQSILGKILSCRNADGGFAWFKGMNSSPVITAIVLERMAKLRDRGFEVPELTSSVKYLDGLQFTQSRPYWWGYLTDAQYMYVRSLYAEVKFTEKAPAKDRVKSIKSYLVPSAKQGRGLEGQILAKARRLLTLRNLLEKDGGLALAKAWGVSLSKNRIKNSVKADIKSLLEYAVEHRDGGWYYPNAVMPWRGLLEGEAYAHALLCNVLADYPVSDGIRLWLMLQKETQKWESAPEFIDAITAIMDGSEEVLNTKVVALSATYTVPFSKVKASGNGFTIERQFFRDGKQIQPGDSLKVGDRIKAVYRIWNAENRSFVKLTAGREASLNPVWQLSGVAGGFINPGYRNVKASATEYYFDSYPEENTDISEEFYVTRAGTFHSPATVIESLYAPHYRANTNYHEPTTVYSGR